MLRYFINRERRKKKLSLFLKITLAAGTLRLKIDEKKCVHDSAIDRTRVPSNRRFTTPNHKRDKKKLSPRIIDSIMGYLIAADFRLNFLNPQISHPQKSNGSKHTFFAAVC